MVKIYFSCAVRNNGDENENKNKIKIEILKKYGSVLTEHLGSNNKKDLDMNKSSDFEIYQEDTKWIKECDVMIADCSNPSLGVGFVINEGIQNSKPVLCLYDSNKVEKISAMINGNPKCYKMKYHHDISFENCIKRFLFPKTIYFIGKPGSGKSTMAKLISKKFNYANISTGQILRDIINNNANSELKTEIEKFMNNGVAVPSALMKTVIDNRLKQIDCKNFGYILDGYPPTKEDLTNLIDLKIKPDIVFYFDCKDETAINRQIERKERITDNLVLSEKRIKFFHDNVPSFENISSWFPNTIIIRIDSETNSNISNENIISNHINNLLYGYENQIKSYFPLNLDNKTTISSKFHFHIDAPSHEDVCRIVFEILSINNNLGDNIKIYPITNLVTGNQINDDNFLSYKEMINFHNITIKQNEAFVTGKLGENFDYSTLLQVLKIVENYQKKNSDKSIMVELEEYLEEYCLDEKKNKFNQIIYQEQGINLDYYSDFNKNLNNNIPPYEIHFAIDLNRNNNKEINLNKLHKKCEEKDMNIGGWFQFANVDNYSYRSNEFVNDTNFGNVQKLLEKRSYDLKDILDEMDVNSTTIGCSIEIVHGIWLFQ